MINIAVTRNSSHLISSCSIEGHAGFDEHGFDIVCAAVSGISCTAIVGLQQVTKTVGQYENESGYCLIRPQAVSDEKGQIILETMILGLTEISRQYPEFVSLNETTER